MKLSQGHHLAYCTNVHRGNNWSETFSSLQKEVMDVRRATSPEAPYAIGLRLGADAAQELAQPQTLENFKEWLEKENSYIFTINGFPHGNFHGQRVKEKVYLPDWTDPERLNYTLRLFQILSFLLPEGSEGSVSTLPGSFKEFHPPPRMPEIAYQHLLQCAEEIEKLSLEKNQDLHLGMEPEPLGWFETIPETIQFMNQLFDRAEAPELVRRRVGVNYDCCHLAIEYEDAQQGLDLLQGSNIRLSKLHLSSALRAQPTEENLATLQSFVEEVYLHQVVRAKDGRVIDRIKDLDLALFMAKRGKDRSDEWRVHFHVPLHCSPGNGLGDTQDHVLHTLDWLQKNPDACHHLEMETYTWEVLPKALKSLSVVEQVTKEYQWTLAALKQRGLAE
jgi:hypothetical protein